MLKDERGSSFSSSCIFPPLIRDGTSKTAPDSICGPRADPLPPLSRLRILFSSLPLLFKPALHHTVCFVSEIVFGS